MIQHVIVIGAGIGGLSCAARLARAGHRVTVVEKNAQPGGRCGQIVRGGHRFDIGPTVLLMPALFEQTYAALGERMADHLDLAPIDPLYRVHFEDGLRLTLTHDLAAMRAQLEQIEPGAFGALLRFLARGADHHAVALEHFLSRDFHRARDYFSPANLARMLRVRAWQRHYDHVGQHFDDPRLRAAFSFQNMYLGVSPFEAPATFSLLQYSELTEGLWFPRGGLYRVIESLAEIAKRNGVTLHYRSPVARVRLSGQRATGVELADGRTIDADVVVANADLPYVYRSLLPDDPAVPALEEKRYSSSAITFYWGLDRRYPQLGAHEMFLAGDYRTSFEAIFEEQTLPDRPSFYVHAPARLDPDAAPDDGDTLMVLVPTGHLAPGETPDLSAHVDRARRAVRARLAGALGVDDLAAHTTVEVVYNPRDWAQRFNLARGAAFGLSHTYDQLGYLRPHNRHDRYRNLYFVGASTQPGTGLPIVLRSAALTAARILEDLGQPASDAVAPGPPAVAWSSESAVDAVHEA